VMEKGFKEFKVGDLVITPRAGCSKLDFHWKGPFRVSERSDVRICVRVRLTTLLFGCLRVQTMLILWRLLLLLRFICIETVFSRHFRAAPLGAK
jgi:hypothetical protein